MTKPGTVWMLADLPVNYTASGDHLLQLPDCLQSPGCALLDFCPLALTSSPHLAKADLQLTASHVAKASPEPLKFLLLSLTTAGVTGVYHTAGGGSP